MQKNKNTEFIRQLGINPEKPDSFQLINEPLMRNLNEWAGENIGLNDVIQSYFNINVKTKLMAVLLDLDLSNWVGIAASWQENNLSGQIRIDSKLTEYFMHKAFGASPVNQPFNIKKMNELELGILQVFLEKIETEMKNYWEIDQDHPHLMDTIFLVWVIESEEGEVGRVAFGIPASFKPKADGKFQDVTDIHKLANTGISVPINISVGKTKLTYNDIQSIEGEDLLIFEESDVSKLYWHFGEIGVVLPEEDHSVYLNDVDNIEELANEMTDQLNTQTNDPLSSLPLELSAEFQKVKIPLKQVLELKNGGVLPLGPLLDTELTLTAQGKPVARGELVIVGNQFGMRISDLLIGSQAGLGAQEGVDLSNIQAQQPAQQPAAEQFQQQPMENIEEQPAPGGNDQMNFQDELENLEGG